MRPATIRSIFNILTLLASVYAGIVLYVFTAIEIEEHPDWIDTLQHKGQDFYVRFRQSSAAAAALQQQQSDSILVTDVNNDSARNGPKEPECPLPSPDDKRIRISREPPAPHPHLLRTGDAKYLPSTKPTDESCLRWKSSDGCWEHYASSAKLCRFDDMAFDANKFHVSKGGERPEDVRGRYEHEELFEVDYCGIYLPFKPTIWTRWYQSKLIEAAGVGVPDKNVGQCDIYLPGLTLLYERIEYANLYHTMTDWFNVHWSLEKLKYTGGDQQLRIIWLDGHAAGNLDEAYADIFHANITYISQYQNQGQDESIICMERAAWLPKASPIYDTEKQWVVEWEGDSVNCRVMDRFVERVLTEYDVPLDRPMDSSLDLVIDRQPYFAHPRVDMEKARDQRTLPNMQDMFPNSHVIRLHEMSFREQVQLVSRAKSLRGIHGAGLSHLLWLPKGAALVEWKPKGFEDNLLFRNLATWKDGLIYHTGPVPQKEMGIIQRFANFLFGRNAD